MEKTTKMDEATESTCPEFEFRARRMNFSDKRRSAAVWTAALLDARISPQGLRGRALRHL